MGDSDTLYPLLSLILINSLYGAVWNSPHDSSKVTKDILFSFFSLSPKKLDPVVSYSSNEWAIISQIYEPPLQYNYIKRPYKLEPLTLKSMPQIIYLDKNRSIVDENSTDIAYS